MESSEGEHATIVHRPALPEACGAIWFPLGPKITPSIDIAMGSLGQATTGK